MGDNVISGIVIAFISSVFAFVGVWYSSMKESRGKKDETTSADWDRFTSKLQAQLDKQDEKLQEQDDKINALVKENERTRSKLFSIQEQLDTLKAKYDLAIQHIVVYRKKFGAIMTPNQIEKDIQELESYSHSDGKK